MEILVSHEIDNKTINNQEVYDNIMKEALDERSQNDSVRNTVGSLNSIKRAVKKNKSSSLNIKKLYNILAVLVVIQIATYLTYSKKNVLAKIEAEKELNKTFATNSTLLEGLNELSDPSLQFSGPSDLRMQKVIDTLNQSFKDSINYEPIDINEFYFFDSGESIYVSKHAISHKTN